MKRILVPTDFSESANIARDYAVQLAQILEAEVVLLNTYHIPYAGATSGALEAEKNMKEQMEYCENNFSNIKFRSLCAPGMLVDTVKGLDKNKEIDMVVMGTTGTSGVVENFLGSNASAMIGSVDVPVLTVPADTHINFPKKIVVANDLTESGEDNLYNALKQIAGNTNATIDFLFIVDEEGKASRLKSAKFDEEFDSNYHPFHFRDSDNAEDGILEYLEGKDFDLLVVVCHQRNFWQRLVERSISKSLVKHAEIPILVLTD
jgi:nucleotide-binding universal stress UspA family protein